MTDSLSAFVASAIEFIIGGMMLLVASLFLLSTPSWHLAVQVTPSDISSLASSGSGLIVAIACLGAAYAVGVIGESLCRGLLEWDLRRVTAKEDRFVVDGSEVEKVAERKAREAAHPVPGAFGSLRARYRVYCRAGEFEVLRRERENQRAVVATKHPRLDSEVESQLRRLRVERMAFVALVIASAAFAVRGQVVEAVLGFALSYGLFVLVHDRFRRYCDVIARGFVAVVEGGMSQLPDGMTATADEAEGKGR